MAVEVFCQGFNRQMNVNTLEEIPWAYIELHGRTHYKEREIGQSSNNKALVLINWWL